MTEASRLYYFSLYNDFRRQSKHDAATPAEWHYCTAKIMQSIQHSRGMRGFTLTAQMYDPMMDKGADTTDSVAVTIVARDDRLEVALISSSTTGWGQTQLGYGVNAILSLLGTAWAPDGYSRGRLTLTSVNLSVPLASINEVAASLLIRDPGTVTHLAFRPSDIRHPPSDFTLKLPAGLSGLESVELKESDLACLAGMSYPLKRLGVDIDFVRNVTYLPSIPLACVDRHTTLTGERFLQPNLPHRVRCIQLDAGVGGPEVLGWRARLLDVAEGALADVHCDAVVLRKKHMYPLLNLLGAPGLLVVRVVRNEVTPEPIQHIVGTLRVMYPQALALQVEYPDGHTDTAFADDCMPKALAPLMDLAVALGIANGDDGAAVKADVKLLNQAFAANGARYLLEGRYTALKQLVLLHAGRVISMTNLGIGPAVEAYGVV